MDLAGRKGLPVGTASFEVIRRNNGYYVDKTHLVTKLLDKVFAGSTVLFTRPRRFGKTLALDMLRRFFDCSKCEQNRPLFEGLAVTKSERCMAEQGQYPVIYFDFTTANGGSLESVLRSLRSAFAAALSSFYYLAQSNRINPLEQAMVSRLLSSLIPDSSATLATMVATIENISTSLGFICSMLAKHHGKPVVVLIDEYDLPLQSAYLHGFYQPICALMRNLFSSALKNNDNLRLGVLTGVLRIAKESLFSGLNNLQVDTILSDKYADCFGFTQTEVDALAAYYDASDKREEIAEWYDGYRFGELDIYNPWSVMEYFNHNCEPEAYWVDTASNDIARKILGNLAEKQHEQVLALRDEGFVDAAVDTAITYDQLEDVDSARVFSMLTVSGYLKPVKHLFEDHYRLVVPNKEIKKIYSNEILSHLQQQLQFEEIRNLCSAIVEGEWQRFADLLNKYMVASLSYYDNLEALYQGLMLGLGLALGDEYTSLSNREAGDGRSDIMMIPCPGRNHPGLVFELKRSQTVKQLPEKAAEALKQIEDKNYIAGFPPHIKEVMGYGMAFCRKRCEIVQRTWKR